MNLNSPDLTGQSDLLRKHISSSLKKAQVKNNTLKRNNSRYTTTNIVLSTLATLLAATAGLFGNAANWKGACLLVAACSSVATITAKTQTAEQLTKASECVGHLKALNVEMLFPAYDCEKVSEKYQRILSEFSTIDC